MFTSLSIIFFDVCSLKRLCHINQPFSSWVAAAGNDLTFLITQAPFVLRQKEALPTKSSRIHNLPFQLREKYMFKGFGYMNRGLMLSVPNSDLNIIFYLLCLLLPTWMWVCVCVCVRVCVPVCAQIIVSRIWCSWCKIFSSGWALKGPIHSFMYLSFNKHVLSPLDLGYSDD